MKAGLIILGFLIYSLAIFAISDLKLLTAILTTQCVTLFFITKRIKWRSLVWTLGFLGFIFACNLLYCDWLSTLIITLRLALSFSAVIILAHGLTLRELGEGVATLLTPLKVLHIDTAELRFSIMIALNLLPVLAIEAKTIAGSLKLRGVNWRTLLRRPSVYVTAYLESVFARTAAIAASLRLKGY